MLSNCEACLKIPSLQAASAWLDNHRNIFTLLTPHLDKHWFYEKKSSPPELLSKLIKNSHLYILIISCDF